jgi:minor tail protein
MSGELAVSFALKLNDQGSGPAVRALQAITRALKETEQVSKSSSDAAISAFKKLGNAREVLGIRSEKAIQNEIRQTEAAYQRLAASGQASARELGRAQDAMRQKVAGLRQELDGVKQSAGGAGRALQTAAGIVGAGAAAKMVVQGPVSRTMDYSLELAHASNTLFAGRSVADRIASKGQINDAVMAGVRAAKGGVTREEALAGVKTLGASGEFGDDPRAAFAMLPTLTKAAAANNASVTDMANIAIKTRQNMGLANTGRVLDMAAQGGIEGQFETRDMAKWLPQQMAFTSRAGLQGEKGFATIVALNQMAMRTAGSTDEAGNNVKNFLAKVNSTDTAADAKKMGIDLAGTLAAAQAKGTGGVDAFLNLLEQTAAKDARIVKLREQAKTAKGDDLKANLKAQEGILAGTAVGKWMQDMQALSPAIAVLGDRKKFDEIRGNTLGANGRNDDLLKVIADEPGAKAQLAAAEAANNMQNALNKVNPLIGAAADGFSALSQEFPVLSAVMSGATLATTALGTAALAAAGAMALLGGGGAAGGALGTVLSKGKGLLGAAAGTVASVPGFIATGVGLGGYSIYKAARGEDSSNPASWVADWATSKLTGRENETLGGWLYDFTHGEELQRNAATPIGMTSQQMQMGNMPAPAASGPQPVDVRVKVDVENGNIVASVNEHNARQASRY